MRRLLVVLVVLVAPSLAFAQAGVQWTRERDATLVSKDVGAERWAITYRLSDGRVTGNVYRTDTGATSFLDCPRTGIDGENAIFDCYGAGACLQAPCPESQYSLIATGVSLPISFFFPPGDTPGSPTVENLVGSWRFIIDNDTNDEIVYRLDGVDEDDGQEFAFGENEETDNDVIAFQESDGDFVLLDESTFSCLRYEFDFIGPNRLEGTQSVALFLPLIGDCDDEPAENSPFFAERLFE
jgi:hypothetical protein